MKMVTWNYSPPTLEAPEQPKKLELVPVQQIRFGYKDYTIEYIVKNNTKKPLNVPAARDGNQKLIAALELLDTKSGKATSVIKVNRIQGEFISIPAHSSLTFTVALSEIILRQYESRGTAWFKLKLDFVNSPEIPFLHIGKGGRSAYSDRLNREKQ